MAGFLKFLLTLLPVLLFQFSFAQDSLGLTSLSVESRRIDANYYELIFKMKTIGDCQLFGPNQVFTEVKMAELTFADSSVAAEPPFTSNCADTIISNPYFGPGVQIFSGPVEWKIP